MNQNVERVINLLTQLDYVVEEKSIKHMVHPWELAIKLINENDILFTMTNVEIWEESMVDIYFDPYTKGYPNLKNLYHQYIEDQFKIKDPDVHGSSMKRLSYNDEKMLEEIAEKIEQNLLGRVSDTIFVD